MAVGGIVKVVVCTGSSEIFSETGTIEREKEVWTGKKLHLEY